MVGLMNVKVLAIREGIATANGEISSGFSTSKVHISDTIAYGIRTQSRDVFSVVHLVPVLFVSFKPSRALHFRATQS